MLPEAGWTPVPETSAGQRGADAQIRDEAASAVRRAYDLVLAGESVGSIASMWNAARLPAGPGGLPHQKGQRGQWTPDAVLAVLTNPGYARPVNAAGPEEVAGLAQTTGDMDRSRRQAARAERPAPRPVVSKETWQAAVDVLAKSAGKTVTEPERAVLLTAIACCGICGGPVDAQLVSAGRTAYRCGPDDDQIHLTRTAATVDSWIRLLMIQRLALPDSPDLLADSDRPDLYALRAHAGGLRARMAQLEDAATEGTVNESEVAAGTARLDAELAAAEDEMIDHTRRDVPRSLTGADPIEQAWDRLSTSRQRGVVLALTAQIALHPVPAGRRAGDPGTMRDTVTVQWRTT